MVGDGMRHHQMTDKDRREYLDTLEDIYSALRGPMRAGRGGTYVKRAVVELKEALALLYKRLGIGDGNNRIASGIHVTKRWSNNRKSRAIGVVWAFDHPIWCLDHWYVLDEDDIVLRDKMVEACEHMKDAVDSLWHYDYLEL